MTIRNLFNESDLNDTIARINKLAADTKPQWGKMNAGQMLAHCSVAYVMTYEDSIPKPNGLVKFILKLLVKKAVVGPKPYPKNGKTAPQFIINDERDYEYEKQRLIGFLKQTQQLGESAFNNRESHSFGPLSIQEWNTMFSKHIDHHLTQFGV